MLIIRILGVIMACIALFFQFFNFIFTTLNRSESDSTNYAWEDLAQVFTLIVCLWFILSQMKKDYETQ